MNFIKKIFADDDKLFVGLSSFRDFKTVRKANPLEALGLFGNFQTDFDFETDFSSNLLIIK